MPSLRYNASFCKYSSNFNIMINCLVNINKFAAKKKKKSNIIILTICSKLINWSLNIFSPIQQFATKWYILLRNLSFPQFLSKWSIVLIISIIIIINLVNSTFCNKMFDNASYIISTIQQNKRIAAKLHGEYLLTFWPHVKRFHRINIIVTSHGYMLTTRM